MLQFSISFALVQQQEQVLYTTFIPLWFHPNIAESSHIPTYRWLICKDIKLEQKWNILQNTGQFLTKWKFLLSFLVVTALLKEQTEALKVYIARKLLKVINSSDEKLNNLWAVFCSGLEMVQADKV